MRFVESRELLELVSSTRSLECVMNCIHILCLAMALPFSVSLSNDSRPHDTAILM